MKATCIFLVFLAMTSMALADQSAFQEKMNTLLSMKAMAGDAIDTVLGLLNDLLKANVDEQKAHDASHKIEVEEGLKEIAQLTEVRDNNRKIYDNAIAHTKFVQGELTDTTTYLQWNENRRAEIHRKVKALSDQRCYNNLLFVKNLKEHRDAIRICDLLIVDLADFRSKPVSFEQMQDVTSKLSAYSHLFNEQAMKNFMELTREGHEDNDKAKLVVAKFDTKTNDRDLKNVLGDNVVKMIEALKDHLQKSAKDLEANEIKASYEFAAYQQHSENEVADLLANHERKTKYQAKLKVDLEVAQNYEAKAKKDWEASVKALAEAEAALQRKRDWYASETARRNSENEVLREVIKIFKERVNGVAQYVRDRVEDFRVDKKFDKTDLQSRQIDDEVARDTGKLAENVKAESQTAAAAL